MCKNGHNSITHNNQKQGRLQMFNKKRMGEKIVLRLYNGILGNRKEQDADAHSELSGSQRNYAVCKKSDTKENILCSSIYISFENRKNYGEKKKNKTKHPIYCNERLTGKGHKGAFRVVAMFFIWDQGVGYMAVCNCQSSNSSLMICTFHCI